MLTGYTYSLDLYWIIAAIFVIRNKYEKGMYILIFIGYSVSKAFDIFLNYICSKSVR